MIVLCCRLMAHFSDELLFEVEEAQVEEFAGDYFGIWKGCVDFLEDLNLKHFFCSVLQFW